MRILLIRHAESEGNVDPREYTLKGDQNISITEEGCAQAIAAGKFLERYYKDTQTSKWPEIFLSSYQRPQETFRGIYQSVKNIFTGQKSPRLKEDVRLIEKFFGAASQLEFGNSGMPLQTKAGLQKLSKATHKNDPFSSAHLFGESSLATQVRVKSFIDGTLSRDIGEGKDDFLIVSHGAVIQAFIMAWAHLPMRAKAQLGNPNNCDIIEITGEPKNWKITKIYDGEAMKPVNINLLEGIQYLDVDTLPELPFKPA
ncbi:MAG: histidine phosphatase family protein [Alphaproteobacteria bacterium]|nr:histidine phosphatase family protein [Alphaproteobacteria bacterium]